MSAPASPLRMLAIAVVGLLAIGALVVKQRSPDADGTGLAPAGAQRADPGATGVSASEGASTMDPAPVPVAATPRIVEFGSDRCVPCRLMQPVLASLRSRYADALVVEFVDVVKDRDAGVRN